MPNLRVKPVRLHRVVFFFYCLILGCLANLWVVSLPISVPLLVGNVAIFVITARLGAAWGAVSFVLVALPLEQPLAITLTAAQVLLFWVYLHYEKRSIWLFSLAYIPVAAVICYIMLATGISHHPGLFSLFVLLCTAIFAWNIKAATMLAAMSVHAAQLRQLSLQQQLSVRFGLYAAIPATLLITLGLHELTNVNLVKKMATYHSQLNHLKSAVELKLNEYVATVQTIAALPEQATEQSVLQHLVEQRPEYISALTADHLGIVKQFYKADIVNNGPLGTSVADRAYFSHARDQMAPYISDTFTGRILGHDQLFAVSAPTNTGGNFSGIVQLSISLNALLQVFSLGDDAISHQVLIDNKAKVIWSHNINAEVSDYLQKAAHITAKTYLENSVFNPLSPIIISEDAHHFILRQQIANTGWGLNYFIDTDALILLFYFYVAIAVALITLLLEASVSLSKRFVSRYTMALEQLVDYTKSWDGKSTHLAKPEFSQSAAEIDTLTDSFSNMQRRVSGAHHALVATMQEVRKLNSELEKRVEQRTHELELERDKANQLAAIKTRFLANMSHELRTPITIIKGFTQTLIAQADAALQPQLHRIQQNTEHLHNVVNDILDVAKLDEGKMAYAITTVNAVMVLDELASSLKQLCMHKGLVANVSIELPESLCFQADPFRFKQIVLNLISNAVKFTPAGHISLSAKQTEAGIVIKVTDQGVGIAADKLPTLFQAFTQADSSISRDYGGTGLGLYISKELADAMQLRLAVHSVLHEGSEFSLTVPGSLLSFEVQNSAALNLPPAAISTTIRSNKRLLIVDDVKDIRELIAALLQDTGLQLSFATDGYQALELCNRQSFDLIIMDQQMPRMDGYTAAVKMRQSGINNPIIQLSADVFTDKTDTSPFSKVLTKPIDKPVLIQAISQLLNSPQLTVSVPTDTDDELEREYYASLAAQVNNLQQLFGQKQHQQLAKELHKIKGTSACFGLTAISHAAQQLQHALAADNASQALLDELLRQIKALPN